MHETAIDAYETQKSFPFGGCKKSVPRYIYIYSYIHNIARKLTVCARNDSLLINYHVVKAQRTEVGETLMTERNEIVSKSTNPTGSMKLLYLPTLPIKINYCR